MFPALTSLSADAAVKIDRYRTVVPGALGIFDGIALLGGRLGNPLQPAAAFLRELPVMLHNVGIGAHQRGVDAVLLRQGPGLQYLLCRKVVSHQGRLVKEFAGMGGS